MRRREFREAGRCQKGSDCKFSLDLYAQRKGERIDLYSDQRGQACIIYQSVVLPPELSGGNSLLPSDSSLLVDDAEAHEKYPRDEDLADSPTELEGEERKLKSETSREPRASTSHRGFTPLLQHLR